MHFPGSAATFWQHSTREVRIEILCIERHIIRTFCSRCSSQHTSTWPGHTMTVRESQLATLGNPTQRPTNPPTTLKVLLLVDTGRAMASPRLHYWSNLFPLCPLHLIYAAALVGRHQRNDPTGGRHSITHPACGRVEWHTYVQTHTYTHNWSQSKIQ